MEEKPENKEKNYELHLSNIKEINFVFVVDKIPKKKILVIASFSFFFLLFFLLVCRSGIALHNKRCKSEGKDFGPKEQRLERDRQQKG